MTQFGLTSLMQQATDRAGLFGSGRDVDYSTDAAFLARAHSFLLDPKQFQAGNPRHHLPAWQMLFDAFGRSHKSDMVLNWIEHGVSFDFVHPQSSIQQSHPRYQERLQLVTELLSKTVPADSIDDYINCDSPKSVHFANRVSCKYYSKFVREQRDELLATGALTSWSSVSEEVPQVVSGLGVVKNHKGKLRLILDCRYLNLFVPYQHFKYEQLDDAIEYLQPGDYFVLTDAKSGYHHIPMHRDTWTYLAVEIEGQLYAWSHMPFGLSKACRVYTIIMGEVYRPLRLQQQNLTYLIDDALFAFDSRPQGMFRTMTLLMLLTALGFHLSWEKCQLLPVQQGKFLGLIVDSKACQLRVPEDKVKRIQQSIHVVQGQQQATSRQLAGIAGMLMSAAPALHMAPLYLRSLYWAMQPEVGWDMLVSQLELTADDLQYWSDNLELCNGKTWLRRDKTIHVCGDASSIGYAAYTPHGEISHHMALSFDQLEIQSMQLGKLSSVYRETKNARLALEYVIHSLGSAMVAGSLVVYTGDCFPAVQDLLKMKGSQQVFPEVKLLYMLAASHDVHVEFVWKPRTHEWLLQADVLSRLPDSSEFYMRHSQFVIVCRLQHAGGRWGWPTLDVFAGAAKGQHHAKRFYTLHYAPGCLAVNGLHQPWATDAQVPELLSLLWLFPPFALIGAVLNKLQLERVNAILILPKHVKFWVSMLSKLPVVASHDMGFHKGLYSLGSKMPQAWQANMPRIPLMAYLIHFQ